MRKAIDAGTLLHGTYRVIRPLGSGGMGVVYEAAHTRLAGRYAVKLLHPAVASQPEALERFRREAMVTSGLRDPAIVQVIDFNHLDDGTPYLVMEFVDGRELATLIAEEAPLSPARTAHLVMAIASGLSAAHRCDIVHRDLKPQNVFVIPAEAGAERVKILDFGISKVRSATVQMTADSSLIGTPQYMSPEQARGAVHEVDARTDQFALATMAYEMLGGRPPFVGDTPSSLLYKIVHEEPPPLARSGLAPAVEAVLRVALSKRREDRYPQIEDFAWELAAAAGVARPVPAGGSRRVTQPRPAPIAANGLSTTLSSTASEVQNARPRRAPRGLIAAAALVVAGAAGVLVVSRWRRVETEPVPRPVAAAAAPDAGLVLDSAAAVAPPRESPVARPRRRAVPAKSSPPKRKDLLIDEL